MRIRTLLSFILCYCCLAITVYGQVESTKGRFEVNVAKGCAPLTITATNISDADPVQVPIVWNMEWDGDEGAIEVDPDQSAEQASFTYTQPGVYRVLQVIGNQDDPIDTLTIEVMEDRKPRFNVYNCINNSVYIDFSEEDYYEQLFFDFGDGGLQTVSTDQGFFTYQYPAEGEYTLFVEGIFDNAATNCTPYDTTFTTVQNLEIASISQLSVENEQEVLLEFNLADPNVSYRLEVAEDGSNNFDFASVDLTGDASSYRWTDTNINTQDHYYCFRIVAVNRCDESLNQFSETVCSIALQASAEDLQNQLDWQSEAYEIYQIHKNGALLEEQNNSSYTDTDVICQEDYMYQIIAQSGGTVSLSLETNLTAISTTVPLAPANPEASLQTTSAFVSWPTENEAIQYYIYRSEDGSTPLLYDSLQQAANSTMTYTDPQELNVDVEYCYQISFVNDCGNESEISEEGCVLLPRQARVFFPNAFTPNGDGLNDVFVYEAELLERVQFQIYNRWGEMLFSTTEIGEGWDGSNRGGLSPQGTYLYELHVVDQLGNSFSRSGKFTLLHTGF